MRGQLLTYDQLRAEGLISGENGERYSFAGVEWRSPTEQLRPGVMVDFAPNAGAAAAIYVVPSAATASAPAHEQKSNLVAGLLALFLGGLGVHKFYLGYNQEGVILLVGTIVSWLTIIVLIGILGLFLIGIICFIEAIIYLTKSPADFQAVYVDGRKPWF